MPRLHSRTSLYLAAALASLGAGIIHLAVAPDHYAVWAVSGLFFYALGVVQIGWAAVAAWRPGSLALWSGVVINLGSALLWTVTRTPMGQPFGPQAGEQLPVGTAGILTLVLEALVLVFLAATRYTGHATRRASAAALVGVVAIGVAGLTVPGVASALEHDHGSHAGDGAHDDGHEDGGHEDGGHDDGGHDDGGHDDGGHDEPADPAPSPSGGASIAPSDAPTADSGSGEKSGGDGHQDDGHGH